jgi:hypothetical protein
MPERNLSMLKPLLSGLAKPPCTIEPASPGECVRIEKRVREYHENPASFVSLKNRKARQVLEKTVEPENGESTPCQKVRRETAAVVISKYS